MNWLDILLLVLISFSIYLGMRKGLLSSLFSLAAWVAGFLLSAALTRMLIPFIGSHMIVHWSVFTLLFMILVYMLNYVGKFIQFLGRVVISGLVDKILGLLFGMFRGLVVCLFVVICLMVFSSHDGRANGVGTSRIAAKIMDSAGFFQSALPESLRRGLHPGSK